MYFRKIFKIKLITMTIIKMTRNHSYRNFEISAAAGKESKVTVANLFDVDQSKEIGWEVR